MNPFIRVFFIAGCSVLTAAAQQETNPPSSELQSTEIQDEARPDEDRIQFLLDVGSAYLADNDPASAITAYERILEIDPMHEETRFISSTLYISSKQYAKAERLLEDLIEEHPDGFGLKNNLAWLYATAEDPAFRDAQKAVELAQEAMVIAPEDHNVWSTLAEAHYSAGQYEKASRAIRHMTFLIQKYGSNITQESANSYNAQFRKYTRSLKTETALLGDEEDSSSTALSVDEDAQEQQD